MAKKTQQSKSDIAFEERMAKQRAKRGFCDRDVWDIDHWFCNTISPMLKQLAKNHTGYQCLDEKGNVLGCIFDKTPEEDAMYAKRWTDAILHLAFLADEMDEDRCSMKNPYDNEMRRIDRAFKKKYGSLGQKLETDDEKNGKLHQIYLPDSDPVNGKENRRIMDLHTKYELKIERYREKCKNEFFRLFSKYYRYLWD